MKPRFTDESRLKKLARETQKTKIGSLRLWHLRRYKSYEGIAYKDRTLGDLLEEFYLMLAAEANTLKNQHESLSPEDVDRLRRIESLLEDVPEHGDRLEDYWKYRFENDLEVDLDLTEVPPRSEWDKD